MVDFVISQQNEPNWHESNLPKTKLVIYSINSKLHFLKNKN